MNRSLRDSLRNIPLQHHRRGLSLNGVPNPSIKDSAAADDHLALFSKSRRSLSLASSDESDVPMKLGRLSIGSAKQGKNELDDFLSDGEKHDYDWLLTPPGTPLVPSSDGNESQPGLVAPRRSVSTTKASRLSVSQSESNHAAKPTRSSSLTHPSVSSSHISIYSNKSANILNTSFTSLSSYIRPSTPSHSSPISRTSTPSARSTVSRSTTPSKPRPSVSTSGMDKARSFKNSRPSTPTSRPQISTNVKSPATRITSRPSTPIRRSTTPSLSPVSVPSTPGGRSLPNGRNNTASVSRPSSPSPRVTPQAIVFCDFPLDTQPNLQRLLPDRPISAGRSRPGVGVAAKGNMDAMTNNSSAPRRHSSPVASRGRLAEPTGRHRTVANENLGDAVDSRRELPTRRPAKTSTDNTGFGRNISKKSLDMAIRHMDVRNVSNGVRLLTGSNLFPQSIRSTNQKSQPGASSINGSLSSGSNGAVAENGNHIIRFSESGNEEGRTQSSAKLSNIDIYESSRYDMILLKEDLKHTNWLHSLDDKTDQRPIFDNGFELLPEPFDPL